MEKIIFDENYIVKKIGNGLESEVFLYYNKGSFEALKIFKREIHYKTDNGIVIRKVTEEMLENKKRKIELLSKEPCLNNDLKITSLVYNKDSRFIGYTSKYELTESFNDYSFKSFHIRLELLKKLKERINILNENGIYIGDFINLNNFAIKDGNVFLFDIDNYYVKGLDFDFDNMFINDYLKKNNDISNIDVYCFNYFSMAYADKRSINYIEDYLRIHGLPRRFKTEKNKSLLKELLDRKCSNREFLIDNEKKGLF